LVDALDVGHVYTDGLRAKTDRAVSYGDQLCHFVDPERTAVGQELFGCIHPAEYFYGGVALDHVHKVFYISRDVEADEVTLKQAADDFPAPWDYIEYVCRWECGMVEESNAKIGPPPPQESGNHPEVVLMNPHQRIGLSLFRYPVSKAFIDPQVMLPMVVIEFGFTDERENGWPERLFGKHPIKKVNIFLRQRNDGRPEVWVFFSIDM